MCIDEFVYVLKRPKQRNACSTYNLLAEEGRRVAAALLPPTPQAWK